MYMKRKTFKICILTFRTAKYEEVEMFQFLFLLQKINVKS
jgi:hypothetical protein